MVSLGVYNVEVTIQNVNGGADGNTDNNVLDKNIKVVPVAPIKRVFGEEATGTWCGWCVRGHVYMDSMQIKYPDLWIGVAVHNGDPMVVTEYDDAIGGFIGGYPSGLVDRDGEEYDPTGFENAYLENLNNVPPVALEVNNVTWNPGTRLVSFDVEGTFVDNLTGVDLRFNAIITEDGVTGTTTEYDQANYYAGGTNGPMAGYENLTDPVPAADMVYNWVARALLGGWDGTENSIPSTINEYDAISYNYSYTLPTDWDENNINLIGIIIDQTTGEVWNAAKSDIITAIPDNENVYHNITFFPNPAKNRLFIRMNEKADIFIYSMFGQEITRINNVSSPVSIDLSSYPAGSYFIKFLSKDNAITKKFVITK
ncbi:MAG: Omp28-related outer membrane protein [Bacteroidia bacterium]|nr:Omp28-related outer membrane protein [Bacteroidia bacterium]